MDYYCFSTDNGDISSYTNLEQYSSGERRFHYEMFQKEVMLAKEYGKLLLFDLGTQNFVDCYGNIVDIRGKEIFPICTIPESEQLLRAIEYNGGKSIVTFDDSKNVMNWVKFFSDDIKREFICTNFGEVQRNIDFYEKKFGESFFLKTVDKGFSGVCNVLYAGDEKILVYYKSRGFLCTSLIAGNLIVRNDSTPVFVTEALNVVRDSFGNREWRVFVVNGKIWSISRSDFRVIDVEPYIVENIKSRLGQLSGLDKFPSSYCVDFFEYNDNGNVVFDICEFNPIEASGIYGNNRLVLRK